MIVNIKKCTVNNHLLKIFLLTYICIIIKDTKVQEEIIKKIFLDR